MPIPHRGGLVLLVAPAALLLAACSSGSTTSAAAPPPDATSTTASPPAPAPPAPTASESGPPSPAATTTGPERCTAAALTGGLRAGDAGAGQRSATLILTNHSSRTCRLSGYGGIQLADAAGRALPTKQARTSGTPPRSVTLAPGAAGSSLLRWTAVPGAGDHPTGPCQPAPSSLRVIPPDQRSALSVAWTLGPVCTGGRISQDPYRPA